MVNRTKQQPFLPPDLRIGGDSTRATYTNAGTNKEHLFISGRPTGDFFIQDSLGFVTMDFLRLRYMISLSLGEVLHGWNGNPGDSRIYMVRDGNLVFYVGKLERGIVDHVLEHCGLADRCETPDRLGQLILDNAPLSNSWLVDLLSLDDCEPISEGGRPNG